MLPQPFKCQAVWVISIQAPDRLCPDYPAKTRYQPLYGRRGQDPIRSRGDAGNHRLRAMTRLSGFDMIWQLAEAATSQVSGCDIICDHYSPFGRVLFGCVLRSSDDKCMSSPKTISQTDICQKRGVTSG